jgi:hypothetical protein
LLIDSGAFARNLAKTRRFYVLNELLVESKSSLSSQMMPAEFFLKMLQ